MGKLISLVKKKLEAMDISYVYMEELEVIFFQAFEESVEMNFMVEIVDDRLIKFKAILPVRLPEHSYMNVVDYMNRYNSTANIATLFYEQDTRMICAQSFLMVKKGTLPGPAFETHISLTISAIDENTPNILKIAYSDDDSLMANVLTYKKPVTQC